MNLNKEITTLNSIGESALQDNDYYGAIEAFEKVIERDPNCIDTRNKLVMALRGMGRLQEAREHLQKIIYFDPKNPIAQNNIGIIETELDNLKAAESAYKIALGISPDYGEAHVNLGHLYFSRMQLERASEQYKKAIELDDQDHSALYSLAVCRQKQADYQDALSMINKLLAICEDGSREKARALGGRSNINRDLGKFDEASKDIDEALRFFPEDINLLGNKALLLQHAGDLNHSIETYKSAVLIHPENQQLRSNLAQVLLLAGSFEEGWREFEGRLSSPKMVAEQESMPGINWGGENLANKHLMLWCEQGIGDIIQFSRFISIVIDQAAQVSLFCPVRLKRLLKSFPGSLNLVGNLKEISKVDFNAPLMSLPHLLKQYRAFHKAPYLSAEPNLVIKWKKILGKRIKPRIGIAWQGNPEYEMDYKRSIELSKLEPLIINDSYDFVSLQKGFGSGKLIEYEGRITKLDDDFDNVDAFVDTAAIMQHLDLIITSDTAIPHLAGALGVRVWLLLPNAPDWRWQLNTTDSLWYENMRLFRQKIAGDWDEVVEQVTNALHTEEFIFDLGN